MDNFEAFLENSLATIYPSKVLDAMKYSLLNGGKRMRPKMMFETLSAYNLDPTLAYYAAASLEMIHTYSLIHDDLPAMDNDDLRRGKLTCHKKFDEATAILAGDALLTESFKLITNSNYTDLQKVKLVETLATCAGSNGMVYGQILDMTNENCDCLTVNDIEKCYSFKTSMLFVAALQMGVIVANRFDQLENAKKLGINLGLAFQIQDDILDREKTASELGKTNSDIANNKSTLITLTSLENAKLSMKKYYEESYKLLDIMDLKTANFKNFIRLVEKRNK